MHDDRGPIARASVIEADGALRLRLDRAAPPSLRAEVYRLLARVAHRLREPARVLVIDDAALEDEALAADGFVATGGTWRREPAPFLRREKASTMDGLYDDPFHVPWNFVPREVDVLGPLLATPAAARAATPVLDLGCGFGKNATLLEQAGFPVSGIDISPRAVARCRALVGTPDRFVTGVAEALPFADGQFACVLDIGCIHCMPEEARPAAVAELHRVLAPGGVLYSRSFKIKPAAWLEAQPFVAGAFGLTEPDARALFATAFHCDVYLPHEHMNYLACQKP